MLIHADFSKSVIITPQDYHWVQSPNGAVSRMMLDRIGGEQARATSIVEFPPHSEFPEHSHPLGEEILVLDGILTENSDLHYPAGWYMRNPHQSTHQVSSAFGCQIFVKLRQMTEDETIPTRINTQDPQNWTLQEDRQRCPLFESKFEKTFLEKLDSHQLFVERNTHGIEIFIIQGELCSTTQIYPTGTWLRLPQESRMQVKAADKGATLYIKTRHLRHATEVWSKK